MYISNICVLVSFFQILIVLTDGASTGGIKSLRVPVENLKKSYVNIFAIGVGSNINKQELGLMATAPVKDHVFYVANMQKLQTLLQRIGESSCKSTYNHASFQN